MSHAATISRGSCWGQSPHFKFCLHLAPVHKAEARASLRPGRFVPSPLPAATRGLLRQVHFVQGHLMAAPGR